MSPRFRVALDRERFVPGNYVRGTVTVGTGGRSRSLEVSLQYTEETEDYSACAISLDTTSLHTGNLVTGQLFDFEVALPDDALPNYSSRHGELYWQIDVKSDQLGPDSHDRRRIDVRMPPPSAE